MALDEHLLAVIHAMYDAALDESRWPEALQRLIEATDSQGASFWVLDASPRPRLPTFTTINFDPAFIRDYLDRMVPIDPTVQYLVRHPEQPIVHDGLVITERDKNRHPYYDWQRRNSDIWFRLVGQTCPAPLVQAGVALHRTRAAGQYGDEDLDRFALLQGHLQRALAIGFRLGSLGTMRECTTELLDRNPAAVLLLDAQKRVVYSNRRTAALHAESDGIRIGTHGITLSSRTADEKLQRLIAGVLAPIAGAAPGSTMQVTRPSGRRPYVVFVSSMPVQARALSELWPAVCVVVTDPSDRRPLTTDRLKAAFGFTEAEARLASLLVSGQSLRSAATTLRITYGTARVRLAELFQKTETRRQGELIGLLLATLMVP
jgi:DNA-binding CsgD family transcriptional regulator